MTFSPIPLADLAIQHAEIAAEVEQGWAQVVQAASYVFGEEVAQFEAEFARYCGLDFGIGVANGTDAIELALRAIGIGEGDEVIVPANTFVATAMAVNRAGAEVRFVDVDPWTHLIDPELLANMVGPRTAAVVPVHLFGQIAPMPELLKVSARLGLGIIEDGAQAQGATLEGSRMGHWSSACATSFFPGKNLGAYGDGGAVVTRHQDVSDRVRALRNYGSEVKYEHPEIGFNSRLDTLQAVVLTAKLKRLDDWNEQRRAAAERYNDYLSGVDGVVLPVVRKGNVHVWHLYVIRVPDRDRVLSTLHQNGIYAGLHYPKILPLQGAFRDAQARPGDYPMAESAAREVISLPLYPGITAQQQERVATVLSDALQ